MDTKAKIALIRTLLKILAAYKSTDSLPKGNEANIDAILGAGTAAAATSVGEVMSGLEKQLILLTQLEKDEAAKLNANVPEEQKADSVEDLKKAPAMSSLAMNAVERIKQGNQKSMPNKGIVPKKK